GIVRYEPEELVLTARAATPLGDVVKLLAERGQRLAFEPPDLGPLLGTKTAATLGGVLGSNLSGSRRLTAGAARDHFLGLRAVNGLGEIFGAGGRVVKNVTGFDLPKLIAGSWGTLAVLTEVTLRAVPKPERDLTVCVAVDRVDEACVVMTRALGSTHEVSAAAFDPLSREVVLRLEGFGASVEARERALRATLARDVVSRLEGEDSLRRWNSIGGAEALAGCAVVWRLAIAPGDAARVIAALKPQRWLLDFGGGRLWIGDDAVDERVRSAVPEGGHALLLRAPSAAQTVRFPPQPQAIAALGTRVKAAFDPRGLLNPGRMG
ncbi:MAG: FAD-binding protein, partial [Steroidobacteraceae bacterium]